MSTWIFGRRRRADRGQEDSNLPPIASVRRLDLRPGDTAVLTLSTPLTRDQADELRRRWLEQFPGSRAIVLPPGIEVTLLSDLEREELRRKWTEPHT